MKLIESKTLPPYDELEMIDRYLEFMCKNNIPASFSADPANCMSESSDESDEDVANLFLTKSKLPEKRRIKKPLRFESSEYLLKAKIKRRSLKPEPIRKEPTSTMETLKKVLQTQDTQTVFKEFGSQPGESGSFKCLSEWCGMVMANQADYIAHMEAHNDMSRTFLCEVCTMRFFSFSTMMRHKVDAHSKGPVRSLFTCNICQKFYPSPSKLNVHKENHFDASLPLGCSVCCIRYANVSLMKTHMIREHPYTHELQNFLKQLETGMICKVCSQTFPNTAARAAHMKSKCGRKKASKTSKCGGESGENYSDINEM